MCVCALLCVRVSVCVCYVSAYKRKTPTLLFISCWKFVLLFRRQLKHLTFTFDSVQPAHKHCKNNTHSHTHSPTHTLLHSFSLMSSSSNQSQLKTCGITLAGSRHSVICRGLYNIPLSIRIEYRSKFKKHYVIGGFCEDLPCLTKPIVENKNI